MRSISNKIEWNKIRLDYEVEGFTLKKLSEIYKVSSKAISNKKKKESWKRGKIKKEIAKVVQEDIALKLSKDLNQIYKEIDNIYEDITNGIMLRVKSTLKEEGVVIDGELIMLPRESLPNFDKGVSALALIRKERASIRDSLVYEDILIHDLNVQKIELEKEKLKKKYGNNNGDEIVDVE